METSGTNDASKNKVGAIYKDFKKLGFKSDINPALDFEETPPGMLALDCMYYFAKYHVEAYTKVSQPLNYRILSTRSSLMRFSLQVVLENSCRADVHECPFGRTSIELVKLLCQILRIGISPDEQKNPIYYPLFFTHDHPFEEFYSVCIILLNKTWKEMRASIEDFEKVRKSFGCCVVISF